MGGTSLLRGGMRSKASVRSVGAGRMGVRMVRSGITTTMMQGALYAAVPALLLMAIVDAYGYPFEPPYQVMAMLGAVFSFLLLGRYDLLAEWRMARPGSVGTQLLYSWAAVRGAMASKNCLVRARRIGRALVPRSCGIAELRNCRARRHGREGGTSIH